jgi:hypothetical protein
MSSAVDAFGKLTWQVVQQIVGAETGKVYERYEYDGILDTVFTFRIPPTGYCAMKVECKMIPRNQMLLCAHRIVDKASLCKQAPSYGTVTSYLGLIRQ